MKEIQYYQRARIATSQFILSIPKFPIYNVYNCEQLEDYNRLVLNRSEIIPQFRSISFLLGYEIIGAGDHEMNVKLPLNKSEVSVIENMFSSTSMKVESNGRKGSLWINVVTKFDSLNNIQTCDVLVVVGSSQIYAQRFRIPIINVVSVEFSIIADFYHTSTAQSSTQLQISQVDGELKYNGYLFQARAQQISLTPAPAHHVQTIQNITKQADAKHLSHLSCDYDYKFEVDITTDDKCVFINRICLGESNELITSNATEQSLANQFDHVWQSFSNKTGMEIASQLMSLANEHMYVRNEHNRAEFGGAVEMLENQSLTSGITEALLANTKAIGLLLEHAVLAKEEKIEVKSSEVLYHKTVPFIPRIVSWSGSYKPSSSDYLSEFNWINVRHFDELSEDVKRRQSVTVNFQGTWIIPKERWLRTVIFTCYQNAQIAIVLSVDFTYTDGDVPTVVQALKRTRIDGHEVESNPWNALALDMRTSALQRSSADRKGITVYGEKKISPALKIPVTEEAAVKVEAIKILVVSKDSVLPISANQLAVKVSISLGDLSGDVICGNFSEVEYTDNDGYKHYGVGGNGICNDVIGKVIFTGNAGLFIGGVVESDAKRGTGFSYGVTQYSARATGQVSIDDGYPGTVNCKTVVETDSLWSTTSSGFDLRNLGMKTSGLFGIDSFDYTIKNTYAVAGSGLKLVRTFKHLNEESKSTSAPNGKSLASQDLISSIKVSGVECRGGIVVTRSAENIPSSVYSWNTRIEDLALAIRLTSDLAMDANIRSQENAFRLTEVESAVKQIETQLLIGGIMDGLTIFAKPLSGAMKAGINIARAAMINMSRFGFRLLAAGLARSAFQKAISGLIGTRRGYDLWKNLGPSTVEVGVILKAAGKRRPSVPELTTDLYKADVNFILADPLEFTKYNIASRYGGKTEGFGELINEVERLHIGGDVGSHVVTVFHRKLNCIPDSISKLLFKWSTSGLSQRSLKARESWVRTTVHPTHSYVTISYDYVVPKTGANRKVICFAGVGDPNPCNLPTGDKNAGIGSYILEFDILGLDHGSGVKVLKLRGWKECGYNEEQVWSIYKGLKERVEHGKALIVDDAWEVIARTSHRRVMDDLAVISTPISYDRQKALEIMLRQNDFSYNLVMNNCQDFTRGIYNYSRGGPIPDFITRETRAEMMASTVTHYKEICTWGGI
ncbi:B spike [Taro reovirus 1]|nr:B spike [Taro reovirus 1]